MYTRRLIIILRNSLLAARNIAYYIYLEDSHISLAWSLPGCLSTRVIAHTQIYLLLLPIPVFLLVGVDQVDAMGLPYADTSEVQGISTE